MKKAIYILLIPFLMTSLPTKTQEKTLDDINLILTSYHNKTFGMDNLFEQKANKSDLAAWLQVGAEVRKYVLSHCADIFGTQDPILLRSLETIESANKKLVSTIEMTSSIPKTTKNLIVMASIFNTIQKKMAKIKETLNDSTFILKRKKNARTLLTNFAFFIEVTAQKAQKDTRMGHRTDIVIPTTNTQPSGAQQQQRATTLPAVNTPSFYEEEPAFAPPTRRPLPPQPVAPSAFYEEEPTFAPPSRVPAPPSRQQ